MKKNEIGEVAWGIGAALGVVVRIAIELGTLWLGLWVLSSFGWLPF